MRIFFTLVLLLFAYSLPARLTECTFGMGYRNDTITTFGPDFTLKEHDLNSLLEYVKIESLAEHLLLGITLDYGILLKGKREMENDFLPGIKEYKQNFGYEADVFPKIGYGFTFIESSALQFYFLTNIGYGYSRVFLRTKDVGENITPTLQQVLFDTKASIYQWFGPFLEGKLDLFNTCRWKISAAYQYHFLQGKVTQQFFLQNSLISSGLLIGEEDSLVTSKIKVSSAFMQVGEVGIYYLPMSYCTLGFEGFIVKGETKRARQKNVTELSTLSSTTPGSSFTSYDDFKVKIKFINYAVMMSVLLWF